MCLRESESERWFVMRIVILCVCLLVALPIVDVSLPAIFDRVITWTHSFKLLKAYDNMNDKPSVQIK